MLQIRDTKTYDVVVCGAGVAGFCAALASARQGQRTALVERYGMPGGILTVGGNNEIGLFFAHKKLIIRGIGWAFVNALAARDEAVIPDWHTVTRHSQLNVHVDPLGAAVLMEEWLTDAGVDLYYHQPVVEVVCSNAAPKRLEQILVSTKSGLRALKAKVFVDTTGDADVCAFAGAQILLGDEASGETMPGTLRYYQDPSDPQPDAVIERFRAAREAGALCHGDFWAEDHSSPVSLYRARGNNIGHVMQYNAADSDSLTGAEIRARQSVHRISRWLRENRMGGEVIAVAPGVASRESRRVVCDTVISCEDYVTGRVFDDSVCYSFYPIDLHQSGSKSLHNIFLSDGVVPTIPLSAMTPVGLENVLVAGRCASGDRLTQSAFRVKASCMAMGEAAGTAAALSAASCEGEVRALPIELLRDTLRKNDCIVP